MPPLFYELFTGLPRQGPGDADSTRKALSMVPGVGPKTRILDIGCGTGLPIRLLAKETPASIVAIDGCLAIICSNGFRFIGSSASLAEHSDDTLPNTAAYVLSDTLLVLILSLI